jgi:ectoine hydroxylase-related dioxygenase (phytanoyl-CoA dioxygenase family)
MKDRAADRPRAPDAPDAQRHPWNRHFAWQAPEAPFELLSNDEAERFSRDGFVVLEGVFDANDLRPILDEIDPFEEAVEQVLRSAKGSRIAIAEAGAITFTTHLVTRSDRLRAFACRPVFTGLCRDLIGPDANLYWDQAVYKKPAKPRRFPWHQDNGYAFVEPQQYLTCWVALTDATLANGCPQVARGQHRAGTLRHHYVDPLGFECFRDPEDVVAAEVGAGGIVVFSSLTPHLTGPNTTAAIRKSYILQYAPRGAMILQGDPDVHADPVRIPADDPARQFPVLRDGVPVHDGTLTG